MLIIYLIEITLHVCSKLKVSGKMKAKVLFFLSFFICRQDVARRWRLKN